MQGMTCIFQMSCHFVSLLTSEREGGWVDAYLSRQEISEDGQLNMYSNSLDQSCTVTY